MRIGPTSLAGASVPLAQLVSFLQSQLDGTVLDKTDLRGLFDFSIPEFRPEGTALTSVLAAITADAGPQRSAAIAAQWEPLPSLTTAVQQQLGLKLEATKGPLDVLVIDSVQKPSEN
jgi:uncharacterized protein (TIGR03435 family)